MDSPLAALVCDVIGWFQLSHFFAEMDSLQVQLSGLPGA